MKQVLMIVALLVFGHVVAKVDVHEFSSPESEALYRELVANMRCLVCQGQNLAGSGSDWAKDVRDVIYEQISDGKTKSEIVEYMVSRFGDSILYDPPFKASTLILWVGPFVILFVGLFMMRKVVRGSPATEDLEMTDEQKKRAEHLLNRDIKK